MIKNPQNTDTVNSKIDNVVVYLSGAQITRTGKFAVKEKVQKIVFKGLPSTLLTNSIQASVETGIAIRSVEHTYYYLGAENKTKEKRKITEEIKDLQNQLTNENNQIELGNLERKFLAENMKIAGSETGLKTADLKSAVLFYNERMTTILKNNTECTQRADDIKRKITALKNQYSGYDNMEPEATSEIIITVATEEPIKENASEANISISYYISSASWKPFYDIRVKNTKENISLYYKANLTQQSGEDWNDVKLTLSTGNPDIGGECPELKPWYINMKPIPILPTRKGIMGLRSKIVSEINDEHDKSEIYSAEKCYEEISAQKCQADVSIDETALSATYIPPTELSETMNSVEYDVKALYTVKSGNDGQDVEVAMHSIPAEYRYHCVRKLNKEVFLLATLSDWKRLNLIAGEASVFYKDRYVGKSKIDHRKSEDKFDLSLGIDKSVIVNRVFGKEYTQKTFSGNNIKQSRQWELTTQNLKNAPIEIELLDQIPISVDKQITVDAVETSGAEYNKETGILKWKLNLNPTELKTLTIKYTVTGPKDRQILLD